MTPDELSILLVDDDESIVEILATSLRDRGFQVIIAADGQVGLTAALALPIDIIFTDVEMPQMTGLELLQALKAAKPGIPVIVMTGSPDKYRETALTTGADAVIGKPFDLSDVLAVAHRFVR